MGNYQMALELYEKIHIDYPENLECKHLSRPPVLRHSETIPTNRDSTSKQSTINSSASGSSMNTDVSPCGNLFAVVVAPLC